MNLVSVSEQEYKKHLAAGYALAEMRKDFGRYWKNQSDSEAVG